MQTSDIRKYLAGIGLLHNASVSLLGQGESNTNYLAECSGKKYVVRLTRSDTPDASRFEREHHFLQFIESLGITFAPRTIHYDATRDIHIISYENGADASIAELDYAQTCTFVNQLKMLDAITYDTYLDWCTKNYMQPYSPQTIETRDKTNLTDRLQTVRNNMDAPFAHKVLNWAEPKLAVLQAAANAADTRTTFLHNDLRWNEGGGNLKVDGNRVVFLDWELSGFFETVPEIGDVLGSIPNTIADKSALRRLYEAYAEDIDDTKALKLQVRYGVLWGKIGNPLWAAERYFILSKQKHPDIQRYRYLAELGMEDSEPFFNLPFDKWF